MENRPSWVASGPELPTLHQDIWREVFRLGEGNSRHPVNAAPSLLASSAIAMISSPQISYHPRYLRPADQQQLDEPDEMLRKFDAPGRQHYGISRTLARALRPSASMTVRRAKPTPEGRQ
jgi:hypothetical protein